MVFVFLSVVLLLVALLVYIIFSVFPLEQGILVLLGCLFAAWVVFRFFRTFMFLLFSGGTCVLTCAGVNMIVAMEGDPVTRWLIGLLLIALAAMTGFMAYINRPWVEYGE